MIKTTDTDTIKTFFCEVCADDQRYVIHGHTGASGYAIWNNQTDNTDMIVCYACAADLTLADMLETGRAVLYLTYKETPNSDTSGRVWIDKSWRVGNWTDDLSFPARVTIGRHNMARRRYDAWFNAPDGYIWHGVTYGENTQICHCRRTKDRWRAAPRHVSTWRRDSVFPFVARVERSHVGLRYYGRYSVSLFLETGNTVASLRAAPLRDNGNPYFAFHDTWSKREIHDQLRAYGFTRTD